MKVFEKLQLFAEGGGAAAGSGSAAAVGGEGGAVAQSNSAKSEAAKLRELGVPEDRIEKHVKRTQQKNKRGKRDAERARMQAQFPKQQVQQTKPVQPVQQKPRKPEAQPAVQQHDYRAHYDSLSRQAQAMGQRYPDFDLQKELENPVFLKLTGPRVGLSVEDAYMAVHHRELMEAVTRGTRQEMANAIRSGSMRPAEHGMGAKAPAVVTFDYKNATRSQREAFKKEIFAAAARGEKIYPR